MAASLWWDEPDSSNKSDPHNKNEDLLVFGYACKLFRDDEKARDIDKGKLLIPWMGDERLMIDRYDGRGYLYDLATHDADNAVDKNPQLSEEEEAIEKSCDEERYLELTTDLREAEINEEEEWKRYYLSLQEGYQAVGFSYDQPYGHQTAATTGTIVTEEEEEPFLVPKELLVPNGLEVPACKKQNARIEKTAKFIAQHGIQMEIMLKAKQAKNSQFEFLHFENCLNPYYKHVVSMIKSGRYKPVSEEEEMSKAEEDSSQDYLHPSLFSTPQLPPPPPKPSKPIELPKVSVHDTPYGALIQSIKRNASLANNRANSQTPPPPPCLPEVDAEVETELVPYPKDPPPPGTEHEPLPLVSSLNGEAFVEQLYSQPPPPGTEPSEYTPEAHHSRRKKARRRSSSDSSSSSSSRSSGSSKRRSKSKSPVDKHPPARAQGPNPIVPPPPDIQPIIDRMAMYVAKNGAEFEMVVMGRKDPRFQFLNKYHAHYPYYSLMKESYITEFVAASDILSKSESKQDSQRSVSFSIRGRPREADSGPTGKSKSKTSLFQYDSSEGEEDKHQDSVSETPSGTATPPVRILGEEDTQKEMEEKLKDKLANAMKERITQSHKEKLLQAERKKKAAMFLGLLKSNQPSDSTVEDASSLYVGEGSPGQMIYDCDIGSVHEFDKPPTPRIEHSNYSRRSRSPREKRKRKRSPTPPSAYSLDRRSPTRPSPTRWAGRPSQWSGLRDRTPPWQRRNRDVGKRSKSRSPIRKEKKKKHRRSKSRSPGKSKEKSRHVKQRSKEKKRKEKSRHRSKEKQSKSSRRKPDVKEYVDSMSNSSDVEVLETPPPPKVSIHVSEEQTQSNGSGVHSLADNTPAPVADKVTSESVDKHLTNSSTSQANSYSNSPAMQPDTRGSVPSRSDGTPSDLMLKVRAMLKRSREMVLKEEEFSFEDT